MPTPPRRFIRPFSKPPLTVTSLNLREGFLVNRRVVVSFSLEDTELGG